MAKHGSTKFGPCAKREVPASAFKKPAPKNVPVDPVAKARQEHMSKTRLVIEKVNGILREKEQKILAEEKARFWSKYEQIPFRARYSA